MEEKSLIKKDFLKTNKLVLVGKVERIVNALYIVSSLMIDREPLKWQIRSLSLKTLRLAQIGLISNLNNNIEDLKSLVSLSGRSALISHMNVDLLNQGLDRLSAMISRAEILEEDFSDLKDQEVMGLKAYNQVKVQKDFDKRQNIPTFLKRQPNVSKNGSSRRNKRRDLVLEVLKKKADSSIKEIAKQVKGCSEKTIQRELNALISAGLVSKKGDRRWSVYSLS